MVRRLFFREAKQQDVLLKDKKVFQPRHYEFWSFHSEGIGAVGQEELTSLHSE